MPINYEKWVKRIGETCYVDDHKFEYIVTAIMFRTSDTIPQVEISYFNDIEPKSSWIEGWRITFYGKATI